MKKGAIQERHGRALGKTNCLLREFAIGDNEATGGAVPRDHSRKLADWLHAHSPGPPLLALHQVALTVTAQHQIAPSISRRGASFSHFVPLQAEGFADELLEVLPPDMGRNPR